MLAQSHDVVNAHASSVIASRVAIICLLGLSACFLHMQMILACICWCGLGNTTQVWPCI